MHTASSTPPTNASAMQITTPTKAIDSVVAPSTNQAALTLVDSTLHQRNALQPVDNSITYYIVAGSFRSSENAQKQIRELLSMGFKDPKIRRENEFYQVYIAYYTSLPLAQAKLNELWNQHGEQFCFLKRVKQ
jgi:sporulation related domain